MSIYDFKANSISGEEISFEQYKDKAILIVNTASKCGFTPQFEGLEKLHQEYGEQGLAILGFPCNQFGGQDPGTGEEIHSFCQQNYGVSFQMFEKIEVNGDNAHPLYKFLKKEKSGFLISKIKWNFTKFLVDPSGSVVERYAPTTKPKDIAKGILKVMA